MERILSSRFGLVWTRWRSGRSIVIIDCAAVTATRLLLIQELVLLALQQVVLLHQHLIFRQPHRGFALVRHWRSILVSVGHLARHQVELGFAGARFKGVLRAQGVEGDRVRITGRPGE